MMDALAAYDRCLELDPDSRNAGKFQLTTDSIKQILNNVVGTIIVNRRFWVGASLAKVLDRCLPVDHMSVQPTYI